MTITLTKEELKDYKTACENWWKKRCTIMFEVMRNNHSPIGFDLRQMDKMMAEAVAKFDEENPFPSLFPKL